jgi:hypothetical protein
MIKNLVGRRSLATRHFSAAVAGALALSLFLFLAPVGAHSTVIDVPADAQFSLWAENQCCQDAWFYTHATETWSFSANITGRFLSLGASPDNLFVDDLGGGSYTVTAHIDHDGNVLGGAFSWVSQSVTLGVLSPQIFLSGTILGAGRREESFGVMQLWASVDYTNPAIAAHTITPNFATLSFIGGPCWLPCTPGAEGPWFTRDASGVVVQPDVFGYHVKVDEPVLPMFVWLVLAAVAALSTAGRFGMRVTLDGYRDLIVKG